MAKQTKIQKLRAEIDREKLYTVDEALGVGRVGGDDGRGALGGFLAFAQARQQQRIGATGGAGQGETFAGGEFG